MTALHKFENLSEFQVEADYPGGGHYQSRKHTESDDSPDADIDGYHTQVTKGKQDKNFDLTWSYMV